VGAKVFFLEETANGYFLVGFYSSYYYYKLKFFKKRNMIKVQKDNKRQEVDFVIKLDFEGSKFDLIKRSLVMGFHISTLTNFAYDNTFNFDANFDVVTNYYYWGAVRKVSISIPVLFKPKDIQALGENAVVAREFYIPTGNLFKEIAEMFEGKKSDFNELYEILTKIQRRQKK
jgi:hypothetical protein